MAYEIKKLTPELVDDYIEFFDKYAFCDGSEFSGCYCTWYHWNEDCENKRKSCSKLRQKSFKKELAYNWVLQGKLNGFLAYDGDTPIAWCNADNKQNYDRLSIDNNPEIWIESKYADKVLSIVCLIVTPSMRGKGVATALLKEVCSYAEKFNYKYVEAYPSKGEFVVTNYHGQYSSYEKLDFKLIGDSKIGSVVRKFYH